MRNNMKQVFKKEKGATLVEVLLSVALLAIIVAPLLGSVLSSVQNNAASKERTEAIALAEKVMGEIKAKKAISPTLSGSAIEYVTSGSGILVPYYTIEQTDSGNITPSAITDPSGSINTYDTTAADNADLELIIDQGSAGDGKVDCMLKDGAGNIMGTPLTNLSVAETELIPETILKLKIEKSGSSYRYFFGEKSATEDLKSFVPKDEDSNKKIKLKVTYAANTIPSEVEQLKIFTYLDFAEADKLKIYIINNVATNSGVSFINKGTNDFEVIYMDTHAFNISEPLNQLFKVIVTIKKNTDDIYKTMSYVKK